MAGAWYIFHSNLSVSYGLIKLLQVNLILTGKNLETSLSILGTLIKLTITISYIHMSLIKLPTSTFAIESDNTEKMF